MQLLSSVMEAFSLNSDIATGCLPPTLRSLTQKNSTRTLFRCSSILLILNVHSINIRSKSCYNIMHACSGEDSALLCIYYNIMCFTNNNSRQVMFNGNLRRYWSWLLMQQVKCSRISLRLMELQHNPHVNNAYSIGVANYPMVLAIEWAWILFLLAEVV